MEKFSVLTQTLEYIEDNICESISRKDIADHCAYSLSSLEKMFRRAFHIGIADYISRRKITLASRELLQTDSTVLDIAMKYGYNSHEVFLRAFAKIWGENPSEYRRKRSFSEIYPKLDETHSYTGGIYMGSKFDIAELYDRLKEMDGTCIISFDTVNLMTVNDTYGHKAGDLVIAECLKRIDNEKTNDMIMFRIGGDEFVLLTGSDNDAAARSIGDSILKHNGETVCYDGTDIPVSMQYGIMTLESRRNLHYGELFTKLKEIARPTKNVQ